MNLKMNVSTELFLDKSLVSPFVERALRRTDAIVAPRDITKIAIEEGTPEKIKITPLSPTDVGSLIKNVKNLDGDSVYSRTNVYMERFNGGSTHFLQSFALSKKIDEIKNGGEFFSSIGIPPAFSSEPSLMIYDNRLAAICLPVIVELLPQHAFDNAMENLKRRAASEKFVEFDTPKGPKKVELEYMIARATQMINADVFVPVVRDGTHRAIYDSISGKQDSCAVYVVNSAGRAHSIPVHLSDVTIVREKPKNHEDRYLGFVSQEMGYFNSICVDGLMASHRGEDLIDAMPSRWPSPAGHPEWHLKI